MMVPISQEGTELPYTTQYTEKEIEDEPEFIGEYNSTIAGPILQKVMSFVLAKTRGNSIFGSSASMKGKWLVSVTKTSLTPMLGEVDDPPWRVSSLVNSPFDIHQPGLSQLTDFVINFSTDSRGAQHFEYLLPGTEVMIPMEEEFNHRRAAIEDGRVAAIPNGKILFLSPVSLRRAGPKIRNGTSLLIQGSNTEIMDIVI